MKRWLPLFVSLAITPVCLIIGAISGGMGHGDYTAAIVLFPYATMFLVFFDRLPAATVIMIGLAALQFPLYGVALSVRAGKKRVPSTWFVILLLHLIMGAVAFWAARNF